MANESQSRTARRKQLKQKKKPIWKKVFLILSIIALVSVIGIGGLFTYYIAGAPNLEDELLYDPPSTKIRDVNGEVFADLGVEKRTEITIDDLPDLLVDAVIATEDARFFDHMGIDFKRIGAAVIANVTDGFGAEGASTITQQVIKDSFLTKDKTLKRKVQEQWLAIQLEQEYEKEEILEMYLNKIYYGAGAYGVAKAAEVYFGKTDLHELTLPEAALLAGLPQRPSAYDPFKNPDLAEQRMDTVLKLMVHHGKISEEQANEAKQVSVESMLVDSRPEPSKYEAFIQQVKNEVEEKTGLDIYKDGLDIYTTLNTDTQEYVELLLSDSENNPLAGVYPDEELRAGLVVLDTKTGAIQAIGGGRNYESGFNYAIQGGSQPGSTFKPIMDYGPAIENLNWSTYHQILDEEFKTDDGLEIGNWNNRYNGWMTMRSALAKSINVPAVKTFLEVGSDKAEEFASKLGIPIPEGGLETTDSIGGARTNVNPLQMAGAYRAFGNNGIYNEPYAVTKIIYPDKTTEEFKPEPTPVMADYTAYMITDVLKTAVASNGTGSFGDGTSIASRIGVPVAGKTGSTNLEGVENGSPDYWMAGYTTNFTIATWTGYDEAKIVPTPNLAKLLFTHTMQEISKDIETADFEKPDSVVEVTVEKGTNPAKLPSDYTPDSEKITELFVKGHEPKEQSEKYDQVDPVEELTAEYDEEENSLHVEWRYEDNDGISFAVSAGTSEDSLKQLSKLKEKELDIGNIERGSTYIIEVTVVSDKNEENTSEPVRIEVQIPEEQEEDEDENEDRDNEGNNGNGPNGNVPPVEDLSSNYDIANNQVNVTWQHEKRGPIEFEISISMDGHLINSFTTDKSNITINGLDRNNQYTIQVVAFNKNHQDVRSDPATTSVTTLGLDEETSGDDEGNESSSE